MDISLIFETSQFWPHTEFGLRYEKVNIRKSINADHLGPQYFQKQSSPWLEAQKSENRLVLRAAK